VMMVMVMMVMVMMVMTSSDNVGGGENDGSIVELLISQNVQYLP
jgi:hypothetical protein